MIYLRGMRYCSQMSLPAVYKTWKLSQSRRYSVVRLGYGARAEIPQEVSVVPQLIVSLMQWKAPTTSNRLSIFWPVTRSFVTVTG